VETDDRIRGQVAQILNARELVINRGAADGVKVGMRFAVLNRQGSDIKDPETGETLGSVEIEKAIVKIVRAHDRLSVGRTFRTLRRPGGPLGGVGSVIELMNRPARSEVETLRAAGREDRLELDPDESLIRVGDPAIETRGDEFQSEGDAARPAEELRDD
jgi:hypothetical protein